MKSKVICPDELKWLLPFYEEVKDLLPKHRLKAIHHARLAKGKIQRVCAQLWKVENSYDFELTIYSHYWLYKKLKPLVREKRPYSKIDLLVTFAHELAHIQHFMPHNTAHKSLEAALIILFMQKLDEDGYISEEHELKELKKKGKK